MTVQERSETEKVNLDEVLATKSNDEEEINLVNEDVEGKEAEVEDEEYQVAREESEVKENEVENISEGF